MAINEWWSGENRERFWMEITTRDDVGAGYLIAPKLDEGGNDYWSYGLMTHVRPGDIILHWSKIGESSITGYSVVDSEAGDAFLEWQARGSYGRNRPRRGKRAAWGVGLRGYRELNTPLTLTAVRARQPMLREVRAGLSDLYKGPIYFPFALSDKQDVRAAQAYLVKFPAALVDAFPELLDVQQSAVDGPSDEPPPPPRPGKKSGYGRQQDAKRRLAVEVYSVAEVQAHYEQVLGYQVSDVGSREAWDLTATKGAEELHIEVKGSTMDRLVIDITDGEVRHAEDNQQTMLVVVDQIAIDSHLHCSGGRWRFWSDWLPDRGELVPTAYRHPLPDGGHDGRPQ